LFTPARIARTSDRPSHSGRDALQSRAPNSLGRSLATAESEATDFFEAVVPAVADDDVIEQRNVEDFAGRGESTGDCEIIRRWRRIARRMIVTVMWR